MICQSEQVTTWTCDWGLNRGQGSLVGLSLSFVGSSVGELLGVGETPEIRTGVNLVVERGCLP